MAVVNLQQTLLLYKSQESSLTYQLNLIMSDKSKAARDTSSLATETLNEKKVYENKAASSSAYANSTAYQANLDEVENKYELNLAQINAWESDLDQKKNNLETQIKVVQQYEENCTSEIKGNIKKDFTYGGAS